MLGDRHRRRDPDRALRAVLVAVKRALGAAQRVVLQDHAEVGRAVVALEARHERRLEPRDGRLHLEAVRLQRRDQLGDRALLDEADLGFARDVVAERQQLRVHQLLGARRDQVARLVRTRERRDERGHVERSLQRRHLLEHRRARPRARWASPGRPRSSRPASRNRTRCAGASLLRLVEGAILHRR
jgi:hypothetical protein